MYLAASGVSTLPADGCSSLSIVRPHQSPWYLQYVQYVVLLSTPRVRTRQGSIHTHLELFRPTSLISRLLSLPNLFHSLPNFLRIFPRPDLEPRLPGNPAAFSLETTLISFLLYFSFASLLYQAIHRQPSTDSALPHHDHQGEKEIYSYLFFVFLIGADSRHSPARLLSHRPSTVPPY